MSRFTKAEKLAAIKRVVENHESIKSVARSTGLNKINVQLLVAAYRVHGESVLFDPPEVTPEFKLKLITWAITHRASYTEVAAHFNYIGIAQMVRWKKIFLEQGADALLSLHRGKPAMAKQKSKPRKQGTKQSAEQLEIKALREELLKTQIERDALKFLASMKATPTNNSAKPSISSRPTIDKSTS